MTHFPLIASRRMTTRLPAVLLGLSLLAACSRPAPESPTPKDAASGPAAIATPADTDARYLCPMHPHVQQHGPGTCPLCGMTLEKRAGAASPPPSATGEGMAATSPEAVGDRRVLYYYDPMRPEVHFDEPGQSPFMDMALVPRYADSAGQGGVAVSAAVVQSLGIRTATPERHDVRPRVRAPARVVADARGQARLQARVDGWIERLTIRAVGQTVTAGSVVAEIYSPELVQAQEELLLGETTAGPAAERLRRFGIADADIQAIRRSGQARRRLPLRAPVSGVVTELGVREGSRVSSDTVILDLSARDAVWIEAQLLPAQRLELGEPLSARFTLPGLPGHEWQSGSGSVVPVADPMTQTLAVRFPIRNTDDLPLGTVLDAEIQGAARAGVLLVPVAAVIRTDQGDRVVIAREPTRFTVVPVKTGLRYGDRIEIREGVALTDRVVISGQFLLDAEASLTAGLDRMAMPEPPTDVEDRP